MKRFLALLLTAVLLCACALPAAGEGSWVSVLQAAADLMTATSNVTLHVRADLTYNRQRFKNVNLSYVQDGKNSLLDLRLRSLRTDDTVYESGYTVHCMDGVLHVAPDLRDPSRVEVREGFTNADTILRLTPSQESYLNTALQLAGLMDSLMSRSVQTVRTETGETVSLRFQQDASIGLLDSLTLSLVREGAERYLDFTDIPEAVGVNTVYTPYDYTDLSVEYWDWDEAYNREYEALYGEKPQDGPKDDQMVLQSLAMDASEKSSLWTTGMVRILQDGRTEYYPTYDDYLRQTGGQYILYEDEQEAFDLYRREALSGAEADLSAQRPAMDAWYAEKFREQFPRFAGCGAVYRGGKLASFDSVRLTGHAFETYTRQILRSMSELRWSNGDFDCELDEQGRLTQVNGEFMWLVVNHTGEAHPLMVSFTVTADHYGDSRVEAFSPEGETDAPAGGNT